MVILHFEGAGVTVEVCQGIMNQQDLVEKVGLVKVKVSVMTVSVVRELVLDSV